MYNIQTAIIITIISKLTELKYYIYIYIYLCRKIHSQRRRISSHGSLPSLVIQSIYVLVTPLKIQEEMAFARDHKVPKGHQEDMAGWHPVEPMASPFRSNAVG